METTDRYFTVKEVASVLKVKELTVRLWIKRGLLPARKFGGTVRVSKDALERFGEDLGTDAQ